MPAPKAMWCSKIPFNVMGIVFCYPIMAKTKSHHSVNGIIEVILKLTTWRFQPIANRT